MLLDNIYGLLNLVELNAIILVVSCLQNINLKIQMLAGNNSNLCPVSRSQKKLPLA